MSVPITPLSPNVITVEAERASNKVAAELRLLIRALGPKETKRRKLLQAKLRLITAERPQVDVRALQKRLHEAAQQHRRDASTRKMLERHERNRWRIRTRLPRAFEGKIVDTRTDSSKRGLYFELPNGQVIEAGRTLGTRGTLGRLKNNARRRRVLRPLGNPVLVKIAREEVERNSTRPAK